MGTGSNCISEQVSVLELATLNVAGACDRQRLMGCTEGDSNQKNELCSEKTQASVTLNLVLKVESKRA
eukprot:5601092-Pleurochrysis_carterae.AAC.1